MDLDYFILFFKKIFLVFQENHDDGTQMMTNDDILGDEIPEDQERALKHFCYQMLKLNAGVCSLTLSPYACTFLSDYSHHNPSFHVHLFHWYSHKTAADFYMGSFGFFSLSLFLSLSLLIMIKISFFTYWTIIQFVHLNHLFTKYHWNN